MSGNPDVLNPAFELVLPTTVERWMNSQSSYHGIQRLPDGSTAASTTPSSIVLLDADSFGISTRYPGGSHNLASEQSGPNAMDLESIGKKHDAPNHRDYFNKSRFTGERQYMTSAMVSGATGMNDTVAFDTGSLIRDASATFGVTSDTATLIYYAVVTHDLDGGSITMPRAGDVSSRIRTTVSTGMPPTLSWNGMITGALAENGSFANGSLKLDNFLSDSIASYAGQLASIELGNEVYTQQLWERAVSILMTDNNTIRLAQDLWEDVVTDFENDMFDHLLDNALRGLF